MNIFKAISFICIFIFVASNQCITKHCSAQQKQCKDDKSDLPCFTVQSIIIKIVNTCLDLCPSGTDYACISFCLSSRKNELANKVTISKCSLPDVVLSFHAKLKKLQLWRPLYFKSKGSDIYPFFLKTAEIGLIILHGKVENDL